MGSQNDPLLEKQKEGAARRGRRRRGRGGQDRGGRRGPGGRGRRVWYLLLHSPPQPAAGPDNALSLLQEAAEDEKADQSSVDQANAAIQTMADYTMTEAQIENLITAKGYTDCVAFLGEDSISVVVSAMENGMTDADAARIGEIVMEQTGLKADQIKIIEAE